MIFKHIAMLNEKFTVAATSLMQNGADTSNINKIGSYNFASFEPNSIDVNNPRQLANNNSSIALSSNALCDENGVYSTPVSFVATFDNLVSFVGVTINADVLIEQAEILLYNQNNVLIDKNEYIGDNNYFEVNAIDVLKVEIKVKKINTPYVFLDIYGLNFGKVVFWDDSKIKDVKMVNNFSNVGRDLAIDTLNFTVPGFTDNMVFDEKQKLEVIDDNGVCKYTFYLKSYKYNEDKTQVSLEYADIIDLLDSETFYGGFYDDDIKAQGDFEYVEDGSVQRIVNKITEGYLCNIDPLVADMHIKGYMPVTTKRNALIYIANATMCKILKHPNLQLVVQNQEVKQVFDDNNVFLGSINRTIEKPTKQINFTSFNYYNDESEQLTEILKYNEIPYDKNTTYIFQFSEPTWGNSITYSPIDATSGQPISAYCNFYEVGANHILINSKYDFHLSAQTYSHQKNYTTSKAYQIGDYQLHNDFITQNIDSFTLINENTKDNIALWLLNYYKERETITFKAIWDNPSVNCSIRFYGDKKRVKKITTSFGDVVELEVE